MPYIDISFEPLPSGARGRQVKYRIERDESLTAQPSKQDYIWSELADRFRSRTLKSYIATDKTVIVRSTVWGDDGKLHIAGADDVRFSPPTVEAAKPVPKPEDTSNVQVTGLCHSVQGTAGMLARWAGAKPDDAVTYVCAGINHQAWYLDFRVNGRDAYPLLRKAVRRKKIYNHEIVRNEMFKALGYYVTESSGHNSEYNWWFRKRPDLVKKYCTDGTGWNPGRYAYILDAYMARQKGWKKLQREELKRTEQMPLERGHEYAASIINARLGGDAFEFNGNVPNTGIITNLPTDACVEVPVVANRRGFNSIHVGPLPPQCAALNNISVAVEEMAVEAALTGDPTMVYHAVCYDPLSAAVLSLAEIRKMVAEMLRKNRNHLPQFKSVKI